MSLPPSQRGSRRRSLTAAALAAALVLPVAADAAQAPPITCTNRGTGTKVGDWQLFHSPLFEPAPGIEAVAQEIVSFAVDPRKPTRVFVTNGTSIQRSLDGGCSWSEVVTLPAVPDPNGLLLPGGTTRFRSLVIDGTGAGRVWALAEEGASGGNAGRPHVAFSDSGDPGTWRLGDQGLPPIGRPLKLEPAPSSGSVVYLSFSATEDDSPLGTGSPGVMWGSTDGGASWTPRAYLGEAGAGRIQDFVVDHRDVTGRTVWAVIGGVLRISSDGGESYARPDGLNQGGLQFSAVEALPSRESNRVIAFASGATMTLLGNGGWKRAAGPAGTPDSATYRLQTRGEVAVSVRTGSASRLYVGVPGGAGWREITPQGGLPLRAEVQTTAKSRPTFYVKTGRAVMRYLGPPDKVPPPLDDDVDPGEVGDPPPVQGRITPRVTTLSIPAGQVRTVDYTLHLPKSPTPVDLFLLIDTSMSMENIIRRLRDNLGEVADSLVDAGISVRAGVGVIGVQPDERDPTSVLNPRPLYQRFRKIGPVNAEFRARLDEVRASSGGGDEAQLESLYQVVTGKGIRLANLLPAYSVPPNQDAEWRSGKDVLKVILHATNEVFSTNIDGGHNDAEFVGDLLRSHGVFQVGLSANQEVAHRDLSDMAIRTGAVAGPEGVDCDNNGIIAKPRDSLLGDVLPGGPLVCPGTGAGFERTLFQMIEAISDNKPVDILTSRSEVVAGVTPRAFNVDVKRAQQLPFSITYSCRGRSAGDYPVDLGAKLRGVTIARAAATISCGGVAPPQNRPPVVQAAPPQQTNPQPAPVVPPVNPAPQIQSQVQTQPQVNPQAGAAEQEQEQINVATAVNDVNEDDQTQENLAMSRRTAPEDDYAVVLAGMALAAAAGAAAHHQRRVQLSRAEVRRRRR